MSKTDRAPLGYELRVDGQGATIIVRGRATAGLFKAIIDELTLHPDFHLELPSVWDMRESEGFGQMTRAELSQLVMISRRARQGSKGYRVAMAAGGTLDYGVGRVLGGTVERAEIMEVGIFYDVDQAKRWAFGEGSAPASGATPA